MTGNRSRTRRGATFAALLATALAGGCRDNSYQPPPPPGVTVAQPLVRDVTTYNEFTGHTRAVESVDIRARVQGYLQSYDFTPGTDVAKGDLLFVIEPYLYEARVEQSTADLASAEARADATEQQLAITRAIFERNAGSKTDLVQKQQARDEAVAAVAQAKATLDAAKLDLSYTRIYAPISGRIDRNFVDAGNLVGSGEATLLATIKRHHPIYAYFDVSERDLMNCRLRRPGSAESTEGEQTVAYMGLVNDTGYPYVGVLDYTSNTVDPSTGTIEYRAVFPNRQRLILPGLFVRVRLPRSTGKAMLVPDDAIGADQGGKYVFVVGADDVVEYRRIEVGAVVDDLRIVEAGLQAGDWIVVNGLQRARAGAKVAPSRATPVPVSGSPTPAATPPSDRQLESEIGDSAVYPTAFPPTPTPAR